MNRDLFEAVLGVTVEDWIAADTIEKFTDLLDRRDNPRRCSIQHRDSYEVYSFSGTHIRTVYSEACNNGHHDQHATRQ